MTSWQPQQPRQAWLKLAGTLFMLLTAALEISVIYWWGKSSFQNELKGKLKKKKLEEIHTTWLLSAWLWFPRQPQVVQDGSRGICLAPLSAWSAWDNTAASFMQPILLCGWGYMIYIPPLPLILLTLSTNTRQLFSNFFLYNTSNCFSQCRLS